MSELIMLVGLAIPAWALSERGCRSLAWAMARAKFRTCPGQFRAHNQRIETALAHGRDGAPAIDIQQVQASLQANIYEAKYFQPLRFYRPGHWTPEVRLSGREHIEQALAAGNGAILWVYPFVFYSIVTKIALARAGFSPVMLSAAEHGYSNTRFGIRYLNPVQTKAEDRYISERLVRASGHRTGPFRLLNQRIRENRVVIIVASQGGPKVIYVPLFQGKLRLPFGAPRFALANRAALLPTMTVREPDGDFVVYVGPALHLPDDTTSRQEGELALARQFAEVLEVYVRRYPDQWPHWHHSIRWST